MFTMYVCTQIATFFLVTQGVGAYANHGQMGSAVGQVGGKQGPRTNVVLASTALTAPAPSVELKAPAAMYAGIADLGAAKAANSWQKTFLSGVLSGCHIAFGAYLVLSVGGNCPGLAQTNPGLQKIISGAFGLPFGLMMVLIGGGELFTGNTAILTVALLEKKATFKDLLKNWTASYSGNFLGSLLMCALVLLSGTLGAGPQAMAAAAAKTTLPFHQAFFRGVLCNWLVCMAVYMASGASSLASKMVAIWFPISAFIALGLDHSIANMFLIPLGIALGAANVTPKMFLLNNLLPVTLGNIFGGAVCVAMAYSAIYGSLLKSTPNAPSKLLSIRGGFVPNAFAQSPSTRSTLSAHKTGTEYLPEATLERAKAGNMFEKVKIKKDGTAAWTDVQEYAAAIRAGETKWEDIASDDMDIRVKYAGMFHRKKATPGRFMMRLRVPNGIVTSDQMRYFADVVRPYSAKDGGVVDITTRANIQLRGMPLEDCADVVKGLQARGLTSLMSGLDNLRNMVGSPIAGIDPLEIYDTRLLCKQIDSWYSGDGQGNPEWCNMPRKFNICISGGRDDFAHTHINDIGLQPVKHAATGEMGFNVVLGGYFSIKRAAESVPMGVWIPEKDAFNLCKAILRLFRDEGARGDRQKARLMWLIEEWGMETFVKRVHDEMLAYDPSTATFQGPQSRSDQWTHGHRDVVGVHPQKQEGKSWVGIHVPVGRLSVQECDSLAALADKYSHGELRFTVEQNVILPNVDNDQVAALLAESALAPGSRLSVAPGNVIGHVVSCTGAQFCSLALVETKLKIDSMIRQIDALVTCPSPVRIHMTGCPNSCGQAQVADIGLMGAPAKKADAEGIMKAVSGVNVFVGGHIGEDGHLVQEPLVRGIPFSEEDLVPVLVKLLIERHDAKMRV